MKRWRKTLWLEEPAKLLVEISVWPRVNGRAYAKVVYRQRWFPGDGQPWPKAKHLNRHFEALEVDAGTEYMQTMLVWAVQEAVK